MDLDQLEAFVKVVQAGSFSRAARILGREKSRVSRSVAALEAALGVRLLQRTTRSLSTTEIGKDVFERAVGILAAVEDTEGTARRMQSVPQGELRITAGVEFGNAVVSRWVRAFLARHPAVTVDLVLTAQTLDLVHEGFDLAIRIGPLADSSLSARKLGELSYRLFASATYLERHGIPATPGDLAQHACLVFTGGTHEATWHLHGPHGECDVTVPARLRANSALALRDAAIESQGIALLPVLLCDEAVTAGALRIVLPAWCGQPVPVHAVFPSQRFLAAKLRAFVDFIADEAKRMRW